MEYHYIDFRKKQKTWKKFDTYRVCFRSGSKTCLLLSGIILMIFSFVCLYMYVGVGRKCLSKLKSWELKVYNWNVIHGEIFLIRFSSVQSLNHVQLFATPWTAAYQASLSITNSKSLLKLMSIESVIHPTISSSVVPFSSCPQSLPASGSFPMSQLFASSGQSTGVSALASFFQSTPRADLLQNGLVGSPCSPRDSQESSPTPQFKIINSSALSFLYGWLQ